MVLEWYLEQPFLLEHSEGWWQRSETVATIAVSSTFCRHLVMHLRHCYSTLDRLTYITGAKMYTVFSVMALSALINSLFFFFTNAPLSFTCSLLPSPTHAQAPVEYLMWWSAIWTGVNSTIVAPQLFWVKWGGVAHMTLSLLWNPRNLYVYNIWSRAARLGQNHNHDYFDQYWGHNYALILGTAYFYCTFTFE